MVVTRISRIGWLWQDERVERKLLQSLWDSEQQLGWDLRDLNFYSIAFLSCISHLEFSYWVLLIAVTWSPQVLSSVVCPKPMDSTM